MDITVSRDTVHAADEPEPYVRAVPDGSTIGELIAPFAAARGLASIQGGRATWLARLGAGDGRRPVAVIAQQWPEPCFLVEPATPLGPDDTELDFAYLTQRDPDVVVAECRAGITPARYD